MAINKNHEFEELDGVKCAIVEKNVSKDRVAFLKDLLEYNGFKVVVVATPPPKPAPVAASKPPVATAVNTDTPATNAEPPAAAEGLPQTEQASLPAEAAAQAGNLPTGQAGIEPPAPPPETFTVGVTNVSFNPTNAIFGRLLRTKDGHVVTMHYWEQKETESHDEIPYFDQKP